MFIIEKQIMISQIRINTVEYPMTLGILIRDFRKSKERQLAIKRSNLLYYTQVHNLWVFLF